ncbi:MAG: CopG family transcriptional regulator [Calothrix sp. MO_192.B10]|nr:CopG family transcriptional regulator [Calothrix sp. MO_192.B10]
MTKKRKSLDDALAREFVYGQQETQPQPTITSVEQVEEEPEPEPPPPKPSAPTKKRKSASTKTKKPSLMSQLQQDNSKEATVRLTVDLPQSMHRKLSMLAAQTGRKKAEIVRFLLDEALQEVEE